MGKGNFRTVVLAGKYICTRSGPYPREVVQSLARNARERDFYNSGISKQTAHCFYIRAALLSGARFLSTDTWVPIRGWWIRTTQLLVVWN